jgi:hypothetical protein
MKRFVGYIIDKAVKALPRKKKVSPDIKSVKPTKDIKGSVERTKTNVFSKNIKDLDKAEKKIKEGKKMMKEGVKSRKQMTGTGRAFQFRGSKSYHAIRPGDKELYGKNMKVEKTKKFKTAKEMEKDERRKRDREPFMGGGMMGRRMGYQAGSKKGKVPTTPKEKAFGMLSVNKGLDKNKNITFTDKIAGATGGKKKKRVI